MVDSSTDVFCMGGSSSLQCWDDGLRVALRAHKPPAAKRASPNWGIAGDSTKAVGLHIVIVGLRGHRVCIP